MARRFRSSTLEALAEYRIFYHGTQFWVPHQDVLMGRSRSCGIVIRSKQASRHHARLRLSGEQLMLRDLGSKNGTLLNKQRIRGEVEVMVGDILEIAGERLEVQSGREECLDTYRMRPMWGPEEDQDETYTRERTATLDMVEVLMENRHCEHLRERTSRAVRTTVDELLDQAGFGKPKLSPEDVARVRQLADKLAGMCPNDTIQTWRAQLDQRLNRASLHPQPRPPLDAL